MATPIQIYDSLIRDESSVVRIFNAATAIPPWEHLPEEERINFLREMIEPLLRHAVVERNDEALCLRLLSIAARHGEYRKEQGFPDDILLRDIDLFGRAVVSQAMRADGETEFSLCARIEGILSLAFLAALRGYHRRELEARGRWLGVLEELVATRHAFYRGENAPEADSVPLPRTRDVPRILGVSSAPGGRQVPRRTVSGTVRSPPESGKTQRRPR